MQNVSERFFGAPGIFLQAGICSICCINLEPFWQLAEEFDVPVGIHIGPGPLGIAYESSPLWPPVKSPRYRMTVGDPLLLEEVLVKHQRLRLYVMHAGWPRLESMIALLSVHPGVYVDVAALQSEAVMPHPAYYRYLRGLVESGFAKRIMFGSDFSYDPTPSPHASTNST